MTFEARQYEGSLRTFYVPDRLWRLSPIDRFGPPPARYRSGQRRRATLHRREDRLALYVWMLEHSDPIEVLDHLDGALLIEGWNDMAHSLHPEVVRAWAPLVLAPAEYWLVSHVRERMEQPKPGPPSAYRQRKLLAWAAEYIVGIATSANGWEAGGSWNPALLDLAERTDRRRPR